MCARTVSGSEHVYYWCSGALIFLKYTSVLNVAPLPNTFLSYTWLSKYFFLHPDYIFYFTVYLMIWCIDENILMCWSWWQKSLQGNEDMWSNSEYVNFVYLKVLLADPKNELRILSSISFLHYKSQKIEFLKTLSNLDNKLAIEMC